MPDARSAHDEQQLRTFRMLVLLVAAAALVAVVAGLLLLIVDPDDGSTGEGALGITAALGGLLTGALAGAAAIYAQVKNLWRFAATWVRVLAWAVIAAALVYAWSQAGS